MGTVYLKEKKWDAAIQIYTEMVASRQFDLYETPYKAYNNLALAYYQKDEFAADTR